MPKLRLAFKLLPYLEIIKPLEHLGASKFFFVWIDPKSKRKEVRYHEEVHVLFWYLITVVSFLGMLPFIPYWLALPLAAIVKPLASDIIHTPWKAFEESFAYARNIAHHNNPAWKLDELRRSQYHKDKYGDNFPKKVAKRMKWFT